MMLAVLTAGGAVAAGAVGHFTERITQARAALSDGEAQMARGEWEGAVGTLGRGLSAARDIPFRRDLAEQVAGRLRHAEQERASADRARTAHELHRLADRVRFRYGATDLPAEGSAALKGRCGALWEGRGRVVERLSPAGGPAPESAFRDDLLVRNLLLADGNVVDQDLIARDIQRARDHGVGTYNQLRQAYGLQPVTSFAQITSDPAVQQMLQATYGTVDTIDPLECMFAEDHVPGDDPGYPRRSVPAAPRRRPLLLPQRAVQPRRAEAAPAG
jgi:hypothetical protein